jgi:hypothetical protein
VRPWPELPHNSVLRVFRIRTKALLYKEFVSCLPNRT